MVARRESSTETRLCRPGSPEALGLALAPPFSRIDEALLLNSSWLCSVFDLLIAAFCVKFVPLLFVF